MKVHQKGRTLLSFSTIHARVDMLKTKSARQLKERVSHPHERPAGVFTNKRDTFSLTEIHDLSCKRIQLVGSKNFDFCNSAQTRQTHWLSFRSERNWLHPFPKLCRLGTGISRALDAVPHGGASITASTLSSSIHCKTVAWPSCFDKSTFATGPLTLLLSIMWSIPRASPPIALNAAATPAVPQNKSKRKSCFECVVAFDPARPSTS